MQSLSVALTSIKEELMLKNQSPLVSIVIPNFNKAYCIEKTIRSVINQTYKNWELIVVDNNSTDKSVDLIKSFKDKRISINLINNNGIIAKSRNLGIKISRGEYIAFLDSDDWWSKTKLERSLSELELGYDLVYHNLFVVTSNMKYMPCFRQLKTRSLDDPIFFDLLENGNAINNSSVVARKNILVEINGFSEDKELVGSEDFDGWIRFSLKSSRFKRLNSTLGYYWYGGGNMTSPKRTLSNILFLKNLYKDNLNKKYQNGLAPWMMYSLSRSYLGTSNFNKAYRYALLGLQSKLRIWLKVKLLVTIITVGKRYFLR